MFHQSFWCQRIRWSGVFLWIHQGFIFIKSLWLINILIDVIVNSFYHSIVISVYYKLTCIVSYLYKNYKYCMFDFLYFLY
jgi:hypothetical protein